MNPFVFSDPVAVEDLLDRDHEAEAMLRTAESGTNSRLVAPRRYGKTSLLRRVIRDADREGWATVYVDFFGVLTLADIAHRIERAYSEQLEGRLATWFTAVRRGLKPTLRLGGGPVPAGVEIGLDPQAEIPLLERLALPRKILERHGRRTLVVFDEFQDVLATRDNADAVIRSEIQHHGDAASYIFAGSQVGMMRELFTDRRRAFYGQTTAVSLPPLADEDVADYLALRFERTGRDIGTVLGPLLDLAGGHPQRTMLLAHYLWERVLPRQAPGDEIWEETRHAVMRQLDDEFRAIWTSLPVSQRRVLVTVAEGMTPLYGRHQRHGGSRGGTVRNAVHALADRGEIVTDEALVTGYRLVDPLLRSWILEGQGSLS